jgi:hypothetical protein
VREKRPINFIWFAKVIWRWNCMRPNGGAMTVLTVGAGEVLGWSWLVPPYRWNFDARALEPTRAIALDGKCLRTKAEQDPRPWLRNC